MTERLRAISFSDIEGWPDDDHCLAFRCWQKSAARIATDPPKTRMPAVDGKRLQAIARSTPDSICSRTNARRFFEHHFEPARLDADPNLDPFQSKSIDHGEFEFNAGFLTGYFEPVHGACHVQSDEFPVPLLKRPAALIDLSEDNQPESWSDTRRFGWRANGAIVEPPDRASIEGGTLDSQGLELAWVTDPVTAFFIHVQGSARLNFSDGTQLRIAYDGKTGHDYTSIGQVAIERGYLSPERCGKSELEAWLRENPARGRALMQTNRSYIFFRSVGGLAENEGPIGAAKVPLTAGRSLAVDRHTMTFHTPIWIDAPGAQGRDPCSLGFRRLMVAQDTGSAIKGYGRGDIFIGSGAGAGDVAGRIRHRGLFTLLRPRLSD